MAASWKLEVEINHMLSARAFRIHRQSKFDSHHESKFDCGSKRWVTIVIDHLSEGKASWG